MIQVELEPVPLADPAGSPVVTVIIAAYEAGEDVRVAVSSALGQSLTNIEVLVIDDGSLEAPVPADLPDDPRLIVDRRPSNGGYARVTNHAIRRARGRWLYFLDSDDEIAPDTLRRLVEAGERSGAGAVFSPVLAVRDGEEIGIQQWNPPGDVSSGKEAIRAILQGELVGSQHVLVRDAVPDSPDGMVYSDNLTILMHLARTPVVAYVSDVHYRYTQHAASVTGSLRPSTFGLVELADSVKVFIYREFVGAEAERLARVHWQLTVLHMLHTAARERTNTPLRRKVSRWAQRQINLRGAWQLWREGYRARAVSWALAWISVPLHRWVYRAYEARRD